MAAFPLCAGIWATLVGFEYIGKSPGAELNPRYPIRRRLYRLGGPIVIVLGLWVAIQPLVMPLQGIKWEKYEPAGFDFSIEMCGHPEERVIEETGEYGPVKNHLARVVLRGLDTTQLMHYSPHPKEFPDLTIAQRKELLKQLVAKLVKGAEGEFVDGEDLFAEGGQGLEFRMKLKDGLIYRCQFWLMRHIRFQLVVVGPTDVIDTPVARRFFDSFTYTAPPAAPADSKDKDSHDSNGTKPRETRDLSIQEQGDHETRDSQAEKSGAEK